MHPMKKQMLCGLAAALMLTGCGRAPAGTDSVPAAAPQSVSPQTASHTAPDEASQLAMNQALAEAECFEDVADYMTLTAGDLTYSECGDAAALMPYFDLLLFESDKYLIVTQDDTDYILFRYCYSDYSSAVSAVDGFRRSCRDGRLYLTVDKTVVPATDEGCEPLHTNVNCIVQLEEEIDGLVLEDTVREWEYTVEYSPYAGGWVKVGERFGVTDSALNFIVPVQYDHISEHAAPDTGRVYYQLSRRDEGSLLTDEHYQPLLHQLYRNFCYLNENRFVVLKGSGGDETVGLIDANETPLHDDIEGWLDGGGWDAFQNYAQQAILVRPDGNRNLRGVVDSELNIIIEPVYRNISVFDADCADQFYVVENKKEQFAVFDAAGVQKTEFANTSVYDVQTKYRETLRK